LQEGDLKGLEFLVGIALILLIVFNIERLKLKDKLVPVALFGLALMMMVIGKSEKIMFLSVAGTFLSIISGYLLSTQIMIWLGINQIAAYFLGFVVVGIVVNAL